MKNKIILALVLAICGSVIAYALKGGHGVKPFSGIDCGSNSLDNEGKSGAGGDALEKDGTSTHG